MSTRPPSGPEAFAPLIAAGLSEAAVAAWHAARPEHASGYEADRHLHSEYWRHCRELLRTLPAKPQRNAAEALAAESILHAGRDRRERFLASHAGAVYDALTGGRTRFLRLDALVAAAAALVPGLVPRAEDMAAEDGRRQGDKDGLEVDQGILLAHILADKVCGRHLCHAMLLPRDGSQELGLDFARSGDIDLGPVRIVRQGNVIRVEAVNPRFLNAEDASTLEAMERAVDVATLDAASEIGVLRGGTVEHPKYAGRRIFGAGINLTHLYHGKIPFLWFLERDLGYVHKLLRGVAAPDSLPDDVHGRGIEKPWIAAVDGFAIGGHCQILLAVDFVLAANDAFLTLPARKEGIIPGAANMRLPRFTGDRIARQAIQYERTLPCDSPEGRLICDEVVPPGEMDDAIGRIAGRLTTAGAVSAIGNRRAFRVAQEPLDLFRRYFSVYARDQAYAAFSPALIANLERNWDAKQRKA